MSEDILIWNTGTSWDIMYICLTGQMFKMNPIGCSNRGNQEFDSDFLV